MSAQHNAHGRFRRFVQRGAALSEFIVVLPALLLVGLGTLQTALIYHAKTTLNYATFEAARKGAVNHAQSAPMREELGLRLGPVFGGDGSVEKALGAITQASLDVRDPRYTEIEILNPTKEAFEDFGEDNPETGQREIPNSHLRWRDKSPGARSQLSIQDANLLKIKVTYGYRLRVPIIREVIAWTLAKTDPEHIQYYAARRLPITSVATLRMQSEAWAEGNGTSPPGGGGGTVPAGQVSQGDSRGGDNPDDDGQGGSSSDNATDNATDNGDDLPAIDPDSQGNADPCDPQADTTASRASGTAGTAVGNPIHVVTGNKYQHEIDLASLPGDLGLGFERHYNSQSAHKGILGYGWSHRYEAHLTRTAEGYRLRQSDGREIAFRPTEEQPASYRPARRGDGWLSATEAQITWHWPDGRQLRFDPQGRLDRIRNPQGREVRLHYNPQGHLYLIRDPQGRELALGYYPNGRLKQLIDPNGQVSRYRYDDQGNLARVDYPDGATRAYHYEDRNDRHNLTGLTDERGIRHATWSYDEQDRAISSEHAGGVDKVTLEFSQAGKTRVSDSQGNISTYHSEMREGVALVTRIDGPGCSTCGTGDVRYEYNEQFQLSARHDKGGLVSRYRYDEQGRTLGIDQTLAGGSTQTLIGYEYADAQQRQPSAIIRPSVNPQGQHRIEIGYNPQQQPTRIRERGWRPLDNGSFEPIERTTTLSYDPQGNLIALDGPREDVDDLIRLTYDPRHRLATLSGPDGIEQKVLGYDRNGRPNQLQRGQQRPLDIAYDARGRIRAIGQGGRRVQYAYSATGQLQRITDPDGHETRIDYDEANRAVGLRDSDGYRLSLELDSEGRAQARHWYNAQDEILGTLHYLYDAQGRLRSMQRDEGPEQSFQYDARGRLVSVHDQVGRATELAYNNLGQLLSLSQPGDVVTQFSYDAKGQVDGLTDARNNLTRHLTDDFGNRIQQRSPDTGTQTFRYDAGGNRIEKTDAEGKLTTYAYDAANRLIEEHSSEGKTMLRYDAANGQLAELVSPAATEIFAYNAEGRLIAHTRTIDAHQFTTGYAYNERQQLATKTLPDGQTLHYHYFTQADGAKQAGKLRAITRETYFGLGQETVIGEIDHDKSDGTTGHTHGNGIRATYSWDQQGQLTAIRHSQGLSLVYAYDERGNLSGLDLNGTLQQYRYDEWQRLTEARTALGEYRYGYDRLGNRTEKQHTDANGNSEAHTYTYAEEGEGNRLLTLSIEGEGRGEGDSAQELTSEKQTLRYNAAGSPTQTNGLSYEYNASQRPVRVFKAGSNSKQAPQLLAEHTYNRFGERIKKVVYSNTKKPTVTYYLYDGHTLSAEADEQGEITAQYLYLNEHQPIAKLEGKTLYAIHSDHLGTPRLATDTNQHSVWAADYSPFGQAKITQQTITLNLRLPGQYEDEETGTHYNYLRDYNPETGRYQTSDPIGLKGGINTYAYVGGNPLGAIDPLGLAQFGYRSLDFLGFIPPGGVNPVDDRNNTEWAHEQLWFDDASKNPGLLTNIGFFGDNGMWNKPGVVRSDTGHMREAYTFRGPLYDDDIMRRALSNITGFWNGSNYNVATENCQGFADALRQEYLRLGGTVVMP